MDKKTQLLKTKITSDSITITTTNNKTQNETV